ncbi:MAG: hypothetical protein RIQ93_377 [Verrucomicrobiota bacterium]|jgi:uncharacterized membrane protein YdjX (TVP38/TMEM64 family)
MLTGEAVPKRKIPIVKLTIVGLLLLGGAVAVLRGIDVRAHLAQGMDLIRRAGPVAYFSAMMVLPAVGAPLLAFTIPAGEAFAGQLGMGGVIALALTAIAVNLALTYWLARYALRPLLTSLIKRYGYDIPRITPRNALNVLLVVRLTPGPPFALQGFVLGVAEAPFRLYMIVSLLAVLPWAVGAIVLGQGLFNGNFRAAAMGLGVLIVGIIAVQWVRQKYFGREN